MWNLVSIRLETVLVLVQDRCMICAKRTIGLESFWTHPMVILGDEAQVEAQFCLSRTYHRLENCLDVPDGTPR
jgi:hypothetical protein